jgi:hypothetical protein
MTSELVTKRAVNSRLRRLVVLLWASPGSVIGLLLSLFVRRRRLARGIVLGQGAEWPAKLGWRYRAITLGHVVLCIDEIDEATLRHELVHVRQWERWGPLLLLLYPLSSVWVRLLGGEHYKDNPFEREALRLASEVPRNRHPRRAGRRDEAELS